MATTPGQNPSYGESNPENELYAAWKSAKSLETRQEVELRMLPYLRRHATRVCWMVLHSYESHLIEEICVDALLTLHTFEERSLFSTWFHAFALNAIRSERRKILRRREVPLESATTDFTDINVSRRGKLSTSLLVRNFMSKLSKEDQELADLKVIQGFSDAEIAEMRGVTRESITRAWIELRKEMRMLYAGTLAE